MIRSFCAATMKNKFLILLLLNTLFTFKYTLTQYYTHSLHICIIASLNDTKINLNRCDFEQGKEFINIF